jgi:N6-adenosine-specific RNA methylase IME4
MTDQKYEIVYADFPWMYSSFGTAKLTYQQMTEPEIAAFDWSRFMAKRCAVFSWVTGPKMNMAFRCIEEWEKRHGLYYQGVAYIWVKTTKDGVPIRASGPRPRFVKPLDELLLVFSTHPKERVFPLLSERQVQHVLEPDLSDYEMLPPEWPVEYVLEPKQQVHSRKPAIFRDLIVELLGDRPRIELFAREAWPGWDCYGFEAPESRDALQFHAEQKVRT